MPDPADPWPDTIYVELSFEPATLSQAERRRLVAAFAKLAIRQGKLRMRWGREDGRALPPIEWSVKEDGPPPPRESEMHCLLCPTPIRKDHVVCRRCYFDRLTVEQRDALVLLTSERKKDRIDDAELRRRQREIVNQTPVRS